MLNGRQSELRGLVAMRLRMRASCALACRIGAFVVAVVWIAASQSADANQPLTGVTQIDLGGLHACVVTAYGGVQCWGANFSGQLGNRSEQSMTASDVVGLWTGVAASAPVASVTQSTCNLRVRIDNRNGPLTVFDVR